MLNNNIVYVFEQNLVPRCRYNNKPKLKTRNIEDILSYLNPLYEKLDLNNTLFNFNLRYYDVFGEVYKLGDIGKDILINYKHYLNFLLTNKNFFAEGISKYVLEIKLSDSKYVHISCILQSRFDIHFKVKDCNFDAKLITISNTWIDIIPKIQAELGENTFKELRYTVSVCDTTFSNKYDLYNRRFTLAQVIKFIENIALPAMACNEDFKFLRILGIRTFIVTDLVSVEIIRGRLNY